MYVLLFCAVINRPSTSIKAIKNNYKYFVNVSRETFYFDKVFSLIKNYDHIAFILNFIPVVCFLDAAAVFAACLKLTCFDIEQYKCYLKNKDR